MNGLEDKYRGRLQVARLNFNDRKNERVVDQLGVRAHPAIVLVRRDGAISRTWFGAATESDLQPLIEALLTP